MVKNGMNNTLKLVYFSPTDTTKNLLYKIAEEMNLSISEEFNLTNYEYNNFKYTFEEKDIILLGFPVYAGSIPETAKNRFVGLMGCKAKIAIAITYGDMHYDNSLIEIYEIVKNNGFTIIGMGAFVTRHNIVKSIGSNRPNGQDTEDIKYFSKALIKKAINFYKKDEINIAKPFRDYKKIQVNKPKPKGNKKCSKCGVCTKLCPENAIDKTNPKKTDKKKCICCMRCIKYCPNKARDLTKLEYSVAKLFMNIVKNLKYNNENKNELIL
jgi:Pyruvate/2-oxoacid:ferredoxin oxidoreductase delta subunit/flavodoxin